MNVLIIEDENIAAENIEYLLHEIDSSIHVQAKIDTVKRAVEWLSANETELIFLDIHLADDISFKIFEQVKVSTPIIFTTAYDQYAIRAFKLNSIDYLLKPINKDELRTALVKFQTTQPPHKVDVEQLYNSIKDKPVEYQKRFIITVGSKIKSITVNEVAYFFAQDKYVFLITKSDIQYLVDFTMDKLEKILDPVQFFRINRKFIINFDSINNMYAYSKGKVNIELIPHCNMETIVSTERASSFKKWLNR